MSGGKETPRQKMIGMMYLVLTALLALNVSNAVLEKFVIIDDTLKELIKEDDLGNKKKLKAITEAPVKGPKEDAAKAKAVEVREKTAAILVYLDGLEKKMISDKEGKLIPTEEVVTDTHRSEELMLDHQNPQIGEEYEKKLNDYVTDLNKIMGLKTPFKKLTKTALDYEAFKNSEHKDKLFLDFSFENVPTMAAVATVSQMQTEILEYEKASLDTLVAIVKGHVTEVDQMIPMVLAESNSVVAGTKYTGKLFAAASSSGGTPEMFYAGTKLNVIEEEVQPGVRVKMGKIEFTARPAGAYNAAGVSEGSFQVKIILPGTPQPLNQVIKYNIIKPDPQFGSAAASTLYMNCGNEQNVSITGMTDLSGMSLSIPADQGKSVKLGPGKFAIIPTRSQVNVSVLLDGVKVADKLFTTKDVPQPLPRIMYNGNNQYSVEAGLPAGTANFRLECKIPDDFVAQNRKDANYNVTSFTLAIKGSPVSIKGAQVPLGQYNLKSGDSFTISQVKISRSTYDGRTVDVLGGTMSTVVKIK